MTASYRISPNHSRFSVQAFATGMLSFLGHSPTFGVCDYEGTFRWGQDAKDVEFDILVWAESLELFDQVRPADRQEIEGRMKRDVLETSNYPEIRFHAADVAVEPATQGQNRLRLGGSLSLHGETNWLTVDAALLLYTDGLRMNGQFPLLLSDYHVRPVTALGGAIQLRDQLQVSFDIVALKEAA